MLATYADPAVIERTGLALGVAFSNVLIHESDVTRATNETPPCRRGWPRPHTKRFTAFTDEQRRDCSNRRCRLPPTLRRNRGFWYTGRQSD